MSKKLYDLALAKVKKLYPNMDPEEQQDLAQDWARERAHEISQREDTPTFEDRIGEEELALRREIQGGA